MIRPGTLARPNRRLLLVLGLIEPIILVGAIYLGALGRFGALQAVGETDLQPLWPKALVFAVLGMLALVVSGLYNPRLRDGYLGVALRVVLGMAGAGALMMLAFYLVPALYLGRGVFAISLAFATAGLLLERTVWLRLQRQGNGHRRVLVLGAGRRAAHLLRFRRSTDFIGVRFLGFVPSPGDALHVPEGRCLDLEESLPGFCRQHHVDQLVVAVDDRRSALPMEALIECRVRGVEVVDLPTFIERELGILKLDAMDPSWLVFSPGFNRRVVHLMLKRGFDLVAASTLLLFASPVMLLAAAAIWLESGSPVLFRQTRVGQEGIPFELLKFRSMCLDAEADGVARWASRGDARTTRVGRVLRRYRIDELPQVLNVLAGRMSFVGPRPERPEFVGDLIRNIPYYAERHRVKPGLTGWAQIRYPYGASERDAFEKLQYDLYYAKNHNLLTDIGILLQTAEVVLWGKGVR
ncbi:TIGR03013 family XrtA/PEP-CTERM system glycosyltransferase [Sediminicurvatus halobius]|uniref:UDP-phosphate galactose phosphotransferase n=1 Tax=Sediminicurvatus halobius TaxID=2182432 RepID=A0A2U2N0X2_9GAMM|nr:TIGR03013 family XrtA/PEP-CTERM system glycosyltransferase [Spiribacter halobius]PWG62697.1 UDP-phosphate galactose phosphotransferase [Spiribacter halobius]UEX77366.1 TIGR03013 family PEP-CTERM/XrtA system glycosyltransferase [Spiribacter halobius]